MATILITPELGAILAFTGLVKRELGGCDPRGRRALMASRSTEGWR